MYHPLLNPTCPGLASAINQLHQLLPAENQLSLVGGRCANTRPIPRRSPLADRIRLDPSLDSSQPRRLLPRTVVANSISSKSNKNNQQYGCRWIFYRVFFFFYSHLPSQAYCCLRSCSTCWRLDSGQRLGDWPTTRLTLSSVSLTNVQQFTAHPFRLEPPQSWPRPIVSAFLAGMKRSTGLTWAHPKLSSDTHTIHSSLRYPSFVK